MCLQGALSGATEKTITQICLQFNQVNYFRDITLSLVNIVQVNVVQVSAWIIPIIDMSRAIKIGGNLGMISLTKYQGIENCVFWGWLQISPMMIDKESF